MLYIQWPVVWRQETVDKVLAKHKLIPEEIDEAIFDDKPIWCSYGKGVAKRKFLYGRTLAGKYILIILAKCSVRDQKYRVITAREMIGTERKYYQKSTR